MPEIRLSNENDDEVYLTRHVMHLLSMEAIGFLFFLDRVCRGRVESRTDEIQRLSGMGDSKFRRVKKELQSHSALRFERIYDAERRYAGMQWIIGQERKNGSN